VSKQDTTVGRHRPRSPQCLSWSYQNQAGGKASFLPCTHPWLLDFALKQVLTLRDVDIQEPLSIPVGSLFFIQD
jgi:hypothetical protein